MTPKSSKHLKDFTIIYLIFYLWFEDVDEFD